MKNNWAGIGIAGMSLATAWAIRGQFGHEQGAAWAGAIGALAIIVVANRLDWNKKALCVVLASAVGWGTTGMISYGQVVGYGRSDNFPNALYGLMMLFVKMEIIVSRTKQELGIKAASMGMQLIRKAIEDQGFANIIVATGASQFEMLDELVKEDLNWNCVTVFHLDEYIGLPETHPASFRKYLKERFANIVFPKVFHYVMGDSGNTQEECKRLGRIISHHPIDVAFVGIGENSHLAFNDPPADFETKEAYLVVNLDEACRSQQMGEGWFAALDDVPKQAISMSIRQIMKSKTIICSVPDQRKAWAVQQTVEGPVTNRIPASMLQQHKSTWLFLNEDSASLLKNV